MFGQGANTVIENSVELPKGSFIRSHGTLIVCYLP